MTNSLRHRVTSRRGWSVLLAIAFGLLVVAGVRGAADRSVEERVEDISKRLACPICDGESVFESRNETSAAIRVEIRQQVTAGATDDQVIAYIQERSDDNVTLVPSASGIGAWVWVLPVVVFVGAAAGLGFAFVRWRRYAQPQLDPNDELLVAQAMRADASAIDES